MLWGTRLLLTHRHWPRWILVLVADDVLVIEKSEPGATGLLCI